MESAIARTRSRDIKAASDLPELPVPRPAPEELPKRPVGRYIVGLAVIAIAAVVSTILTSTAFTRQGQDASLLETVTQQIARSETIENIGFDIEATEDPEERTKIVTRLQEPLLLLRQQHNGLRFGSEDLDLPVDQSDAFTTQMDAGVEPHFVEMTQLADELRDEALAGPKLRPGLASELARAAEEFREGMRGLATLIKDEAQARVASLRITQLILLSVMLLLLILEGLFLFRPAVRDVRKEWEQRAAEHESARAQDQQKLSYLARYDPLTG